MTKNNELINKVAAKIKGIKCNIDVIKHEIKFSVIINSKKHNITFFVDPELYIISLTPFTGIMRVENQNMTVEDVVSDINMINNLLNSKKLQLEKKTFMGKIAYRCLGTRNFFAFDNTIIESLILRYGSTVEVLDIIRDPQ